MAWFFPLTLAFLGFGMSAATPLHAPRSDGLVNRAAARGWDLPWFDPPPYNASIRPLVNNFTS
jgi:hypothetical protein